MFGFFRFGFSGCFIFQVWTKEKALAPLHRIASDSGKPLVEENPDHKISKIYLEIAKRFHERIVILDGHDEINNIHQKILEVLTRRKIITWN